MVVSARFSQFVVRVNQFPCWQLDLVKNHSYRQNGTSTCPLLFLTRGEALFSRRFVAHFSQPPAAAKCRGAAPSAPPRSMAVSASERLVSNRASSALLEVTFFMSESVLADVPSYDR